jgi:Protein of unknown function (DUF3106)
MNRVPPIAGLLILAVSIGFSAQKNAKPPKNPPPPPTERPSASAAKSPAPAGEGRGGAGKVGGNPPRMYMPLNPVQRFLNMTPEEQQRVMEKAPPPQRARLQEALDRWNARPEAQKQLAYQMYQSLSKLPPGKQALVQRQMQAFNKLPDDRIKPVRQELIRLLRMPADQRPARFASPEFAQKYSPEEQQILKDLSTTLPDDYPLQGK